MTDKISEWSRQLSDPAAAVRRVAAQQLARIGPAANSAVVPLIRAVADHDEEVAIQAGEALESLGPPSPQDLPALMELLAHDQPDCGYWAATLVGRLGERGAAAVPALCSVLESTAALEVRERAAWALGEIGPAAQAARDTLQAASRSDLPRLARLARESLQKCEV